MSATLRCFIVLAPCLVLAAGCSEMLFDCSLLDELFKIHQGLAGDWSGELVGDYTLSIDGGEPTVVERSESFTITFDEDGFLTALSFLPPSRSYWDLSWRRDLAAISRVGDSDDLSAGVSHHEWRSVVLEELRYAPQAASLRSRWTYGSLLEPEYLMWQEADYDTIHGTATTDIHVCVHGDQLSAAAQVLFEYELRPVGQEDVTYQVVETWTATGMLTGSGSSE